MHACMHLPETAVCLAVCLKTKQLCASDHFGTSQGCFFFFFCKSKETEAISYCHMLSTNILIYIFFCPQSSHLNWQQQSSWLDTCWSQRTNFQSKPLPHLYQGPSPSCHPTCMLQKVQDPKCLKNISRAWHWHSWLLRHCSVFWNQIMMARMTAQRRVGFQNATLTTPSIPHWLAYTLSANRELVFWTNYTRIAKHKKVAVFTELAPFTRLVASCRPPFYLYWTHSLIGMQPCWNLACLVWHLCWWLCWSLSKKTKMGIRIFSGASSQLCPWPSSRPGASSTACHPPPPTNCCPWSMLWFLWSLVWCCSDAFKQHLINAVMPRGICPHPSQWQDHHCFL